MRQFVLFIALFLSISSLAQTSDSTLFTKWEGALKTQGMNLKLIFDLSKESCLLDVPIQAVKDYPSSSYEIKGDSIRISFEGILSARFHGMIKENNLIEGKWLQVGLSFPLSLERSEERYRPQNNKQKVAYKQEDVSYTNKNNSIQLGGTLTLPEEGGKHAVAILITGSGQQDRDETLFGHKPFAVIADYLTRKGIAVLRVDDRGVGASTGKESLKTATSYDFAMDVEAGIKYLKSRSDIDQASIGLIGHSEGGMIASILGAERDDLAFIVSMAGLGVAGKRLASSQIKMALSHILPSQSVDSIVAFDKRAMDIIINQKNDRLAEVSISQALVGQWVEGQDDDVRKYFGMKKVDGFSTINTKVAMQRYKRLMVPWFRYFLNYNPKNYLPKIKAPYFAINGEKDTQVLSDMNLTGFRRIFAASGKNNYKVKSYPNLNHFFQHCKTGYIDEVEDIEETFSEEVLNDISIWIKEQLKK